MSAGKPVARDCDEIILIAVLFEPSSSVLLLFQPFLEGNRKLYVIKN